jgi:hypothetical protein
MADLGCESHETRSLAQGGDDQATQSAEEAEDWAESINSFAGGSRVCVTERQTDRQTDRETDREERERARRKVVQREGQCVRVNMIFRAEKTLNSTPM